MSVTGEIIAYIPVFCEKVFVLTSLGAISTRIPCYRGYEYTRNETYSEKMRDVVYDLYQF